MDEKKMNHKGLRGGEQTFVVRPLKKYLFFLCLPLPGLQAGRGLGVGEGEEEGDDHPG